MHSNINIDNNNKYHKSSKKFLKCIKKTGKQYFLCKEQNHSKLILKNSKNNLMICELNIT